jgi:predicted permease
MTDRLRQMPGVISVAGASEGPLEGPSNPHFKIDGRVLAIGEKEPEASFHVVSEEYFHTLGVPVLEGRSFTTQDRGQNLVAVINQSMVRQFWPNESPIGKRIAMTNLGAGVWRTIIGVVGDVKQHGLEAEAGPGFYFSLGQTPIGRFQMFLRAVGNPTRLANDVRAVVRTIDPEQPIANIQTLEQVRSDAIAPSRLTATLLGLFAALAFVITATGVSAVAAYFVNERTHEIGIRSALGASRRDVVALVLRQILVLVGIGLALGALTSIFLSRLLASLLFGVEPTDPTTFVGVALVLLVVVMIACLVPARRAVRIDPMIALRS